MKEIDPEVAALMEDLPPSKLPPALVERGWGQKSMDQALREFTGTRKFPAQEFQPDMQHCVQCGRPFAVGPRGAMDHVGGADCDGGLCLDEQEFDFHVSKEGLINARRIRDADLADAAARAARHAEMEKELKRRNEERQKLRKTPGACGSNKHSHSCAHQCAHGLDHFGFHECKFCSHLWR